MTKKSSPQTASKPSTRRRFLTRLALGVAGIAGLWGSSKTAQAQWWKRDDKAVSTGKSTTAQKNLKMVTTWPKNFPGLGVSPERIAKNAYKMTDGTLNIRVYAAGELVGAFEAFDAVSTGVADMYNGAEFYWQGKAPIFSLFTAAPFGFTALEMAAWLNHGGGQALWEELSAKFNIRAFQHSSTNAQPFGWFNKEINSMRDLSGLKIRMPGIGGEVLRRLGALPVTLPGSEIFAAMTSGAIDATEWSGPWNDQAWGFHQIAKYYYFPGFQEPTAALSTGVNLDVWNDLPASHQAVIQQACMAQTQFAHSELQYQNSVALETLKKKHKVQIRRFPDSVLSQIKRVSDEVLRDIAKRDEHAQRAYDSFIKARKMMSAWTELSDEAYTLARHNL